MQWGAVKRIVVPRVEGDVMRFYEYDPRRCARELSVSPSRGRQRGCAALRRSTSWSFPVRAFTASGVRCGRGRGYYDKYLSQPGVKAVKVGVCFACQLIGELPAEPHDEAMDYVITD